MRPKKRPQQNPQSNILLKSKIFAISLISVIFGILLIVFFLQYNFDNETKKIDILGTEPPYPVNRETAIAILTIGELKPMLEIPKRPTATIFLKLETLPTYTPQPTYTIRQTITLEIIGTIEPPATPEIQKSLTYQIATVQPQQISQKGISGLEKQQLGAQVFTLPATPQEIWLVAKQILVDVGLWYPLQTAMSLILIIMLVFIILSWLKP